MPWYFPIHTQLSRINISRQLFLEEENYMKKSVWSSVLYFAKFFSKSRLRRNTRMSKMPKITKKDCCRIVWTRTSSFVELHQQDRANTDSVHLNKGTRTLRKLYLNYGKGIDENFYLPLEKKFNCSTSGVAHPQTSQKWLMLLCGRIQLCVKMIVSVESAHVLSN